MSAEQTQRTVTLRVRAAATGQAPTTLAVDVPAVDESTCPVVLRIDTGARGETYRLADGQWMRLWAHPDEAGVVNLAWVADTEQVHALAATGVLAGDGLYVPCPLPCVSLAPDGVAWLGEELLDADDHVSVPAWRADHVRAVATLLGRGTGLRDWSWQLPRPDLLPDVTLPEAAAEAERLRRAGR